MDRTDRFSLGLRALLLCVLGACGDAVPDDATYVNVTITGLKAQMTTLAISAALQGGSKYSFDQVDLTNQSLGRLVLEFSRSLNGSLTIDVTASGAMMCGAASSGSGTVILSGQPETDVTVPLSPMVALTSVSVSAPYLEMATGFQQQLVATATYSDNSTRDVSSQVAWTSSNTTVATISSTGLVTSLGSGATNIAAALPCQHDSASLSVVARAARFNVPVGIAVDGSGNIYVADEFNDTIRKITPVGVVSTLAGTPGATGSSDGTGSAARFYYPQGVAVDGSGNVYVADTYNDTIRRITPSGLVTTLAGMPGVAGSMDGQGSAAQFYNPVGIALDGSGNLYIADALNSTIRKMTPDNVVTTLAGLAMAPGSADGTGSAARFNQPTGVAVDGSGNVYVAGFQGENIRMITPGEVVTTLAGSQTREGASDGDGASALFANPFGIAIDGSGTLYIADQSNNKIRKITLAGSEWIVSSLAGGGETMGGYVDGPASIARLNAPYGVAVDGKGNVYVADTGNQAIREITPNGMVFTIAGIAVTAGSVDD